MLSDYLGMCNIYALFPIVFCIFSKMSICSHKLAEPATLLQCGMHIHVHTETSSTCWLAQLGV